MTNHVPLCPVCNENEVGTFLGSDEFCSSTCQSLALDWEGGDHQSEELCEDVDDNYTASGDDFYEEAEMAYQDDYLYEDHSIYTFDN